jgi:hypothetical protein
MKSWIAEDEAAVPNQRPVINKFDPVFSVLLAPFFAAFSKVM